MVHFQTRIDLTLNMKQFTTYSNMLQVGQLRASEKSSNIKGKFRKLIVSRYAITAKMVHFQIRNEVKLKLKQNYILIKSAANRTNETDKETGQGRGWCMDS